MEPNGDEAGRLSAICIECKRLAGDDALQARENALAVLAEDGLQQVHDKRYANGLAGAGALLWGVAFCGKHVAAVCERIG